MSELRTFSIIRTITILCQSFPGAETTRNSAAVPTVPCGLNIGIHIDFNSPYTLASLRGNGDLVVKGSGISRIQCSFEIHKTRMKFCSTISVDPQVESNFWRECGTIRAGSPPPSVVLATDVHDRFGFGGVGCDLFEFTIHWHTGEDLPDLKELIKSIEWTIAVFLGP